MTKPGRGNFIQTLLIVTAVFLLINLFLGRKGPEKSLDEAKSDYETALQAEKTEDIIAAGRVYADKVADSDASLASEVRLRVAQETAAQAEKEENFNLAVAAYQDLRSIYYADPDSELGQRAKAEIDKVGEVGKEAASTSLGYRFVDMVVGWFGAERNPGFSYWFAGVFLAIIVRLVVWPLSARQIMGMRRMQLLQPMVKELQAKYQGQELQQRMMKLYQKYGINPLASCFPLLITMPVFLWVFMAMGSYRFDFMNGTFLWINEASARAYPGIFAPNLGEVDVPLVLLYGISMVVQALITVSDPSTAKQSKMIGIGMGLLFTVLFLTVLPYPSAFLVYWVATNILTTIQTLVLLRIPVPPLVERSEEEMRAKPLFAGLQPKGGPGGNGTTGISSAPKTGAPVLHKPKGGKQKKKKR